jgi:hypothetical protein
MQQARGAYLRIATPLNQAASVLQADYRDQVPISQYLRDLRHIRAVERRMHRQLDGIRWPARIQGYITALTLTTIPAEIRCASLQQHYTTYQAINTAVNDSQECANGTNLTNADAIRAALGLPQI